MFEPFCEASLLVTKQKYLARELLGPSCGKDGAFLGIGRTTVSWCQREQKQLVFSTGNLLGSFPKKKSAEAVSEQLSGVFPCHLRVRHQRYIMRVTYFWLVVFDLCTLFASNLYFNGSQDSLINVPHEFCSLLDFLGPRIFW